MKTPAPRAISGAILRKRYQKEYYWRNKKECRRKAIEHYESKRNVIASIRQSNPCYDCGGWFPFFVMEFDHVVDSILKVSGLHKNLDTVMAEISKCQLVCANCHKTRTHLRSGWYK